MAGKPDGKECPTDERDTRTSRSAESPAGSRSGGSPAGADTGDGLSRRSFLRTSAVAGAAGILGTGAAVGSAAAQAETVDVVEAGADPDGGDPIDGVLESVVGDGVVVEFPGDGEFVTNGFDLRADDFELRGNGARLYPEGGSLQVDGQGWTVDGFELDMRSNGAYPRAFFEGGDWTVSRCVWRGQAGTADRKAVYPRFDANTTATFADCYWHDGSVDGGERSNFGCLGSYANNDNGGRLRFERCWFEGWSADTTYLSAASGTIEYVDCYFRNTIVGPRVSDVRMRRVKSVHTEPVPIEAWSGSAFQSGVWLNGEKDVAGDPLVEDCDFYLTGPDAAPAIKGENMPGPVTVRNTRIHSPESVPVRLGTSGGDEITFDGLTLSGNTSMQLGGNVVQESVERVDEPAADPSPHIPEPPEDGSVPEAGSSDE